MRYKLVWAHLSSHARVSIVRFPRPARSSDQSDSMYAGKYSSSPPPSKSRTSPSPPSDADWVPERLLKLGFGNVLSRSPVMSNKCKDKQVHDRSYNFRYYVSLLLIVLNSTVPGVECRSSAFPSLAFFCSFQVGALSRFSAA